MKNKIINNWPVILGMIEKDYNVSTAAIKAWIQPLTVEEIRDDTIYFSLDNKMGSRGLNFIESKFLYKFCFIILLYITFFYKRLLCITSNLSLYLYHKS